MLAASEEVCEGWSDNRSMPEVRQELGKLLMGETYGRRT